MDRSERKGWPVVAMAIAAIACMMWPVLMDSAHAAPQAQRVNYCPPGEVMSPDIAPWPGYEGPGTCAICCDRSDGSGYWYRMPNWHPVCYPDRRPPTRRPTRTRVPTATPSSTATNTPEPPTDTPTSTPTSTWTFTPTAPAARVTLTPPATPSPHLAAPPVQAMPPASTPAASPPAASVTPRAQQGRTLSAWRPQCLPRHAARPMALCRSASGSGWWLYFIGPGGRIETGPHVPFPSPAMAGRRAVLRHFVTGAPIEIVWGAERVRLHTVYGDGKLYAFEAAEDGDVAFLAW